MDIKVNFNACFSLFVIVWHLFPLVNGACTWPSAFASSQWHDSSRGLLTFGTNIMTGWTFSPTTGVNMSSWDCVSVNSYSTDGQIIMITSTPFILFATTYYAYLCISVTQVTSASYRYYIDNEKQSAIFNERLFIYPVNTLTDSGTICSNKGASDGEYQMLIKEGGQLSAKINCPWYFLGNYGYTHTTSQNVVTCSTATSKMSMCTNTQQITFNYTTCPTKVAYSVSNTVWCVANVPSGGTNYVMLYNGNDAATDINNTSTFRFTCMAVSSDVTSASLSPKYCQTGQTATAYPVTPAGLPTGALLSFAPPSATCPTCPVLPAPTNGNVTVSTTDSVTSALYTCAQNYTLWGSSTRTCQADRTWTSTMPSCSCATPPSPNNGTVTVNSDGSVATYRCNVGYTLDGLSSRNCLTASASWEGADPKCVKCASLLSVAGQTPTFNTNGTITTVAFVCLAGYTLVGTTSLTCASDGTWNSMQPNCASCQLLNNPSSGSVALSTTGSVTTATYACKTGYTLLGNTTRTCQPNGTWTYSEPTCLCNQPNSPANGAVVANGITATYTCNVGFTLTGQASRACQTDGTGWSDADPKCTKCITLSTVAGGNFSLATTGTVTSAKYTCFVGYSLDGVTTITCQSDGSWSSLSPTCIQCPTLTQPSSGTVTLTTSGTKTSATYTCTSGYNLNGNAIRLCNSDGTWSLLAPTCTCQSPTIPSNGAVADNGVTATYSCNQGYSLNGASTRTCASDGSGWSGTNPSCSTCATLNTPTGGTVNLSTDGINTKAAFTCNSGYTLNGMTPITCRSDGSWDFTAPTCAKCPDLSNPPSGTVTLTTSGSKTTASFSCATGYYLSGPFSITCGADGRWSNNPPTCKCNFPAQPLNGGVTVAGTGQVATYTCATGYSLNGLSARTCMTDGTGWEAADPVCTVCQTLSNPASGTFSIDSNGTHTTVLYKCDVGTTMNGSRLLACRADGTWSSAPPTCAACPTLSDPDSGTVALSTGGTTTTATFSCVTGYTINSTGILTCLSTGKWDIVAPHCVCQAPASIVNGQLSISSDLRTATYTCNVGYVLVGSSSRSCQTKGAGWNGIAPVCDGGEPNTAASTKDTGDWNIPIAVVVIVILIVIALVVISGLFIHMYCRLRNERSSRVASAVSREPENPAVVEERKPDVLPEPSPTQQKATILKKYQNLGEREQSALTTSGLVFTNGFTSGDVQKPRSKNRVQLPPLSHESPGRRGKKGSIVRTPEKTSRTARPGSKTKMTIKEKMEEFGIERVRTPDLLSAADFTYLQPQYTVELEAPESERNTVLSRKGDKSNPKRKRKRNRESDDISDKIVLSP